MNVVDINYEIIRKSHPYYNIGYCESSKLTSYVCDDSKYELLHIWVYPELNILSLKAKFPNIHYRDVVELALVYNPIPESIKYYDRYTCFYYSCLRKHTHPEIYLLFEENEEYLHDNSVLWICYKFLRMDVLEVILKQFTDREENEEVLAHIEMFANMISLKQGGELIYDKNPYDSLDIANRAVMFTYTELIEIFVILSLCNTEEDYYGYLLGRERPDTPEELKNYLFVNTVAAQVNKQEIQSIISVYYPDVIIPSDVKYVSDGSLALGIEVIGPVSLHKHPELIDKCIPIQYRGVYYITSGRIDDYINWRGNNELDKVNSLYYGVNNFGDCTCNYELADKLGISLDDVDSYPTPHIYRKYNC